MIVEEQMLDDFFVVSKTTNFVTFPISLLEIAFLGHSFIMITYVIFIKI